MDTSLAVVSEFYTRQASGDLAGAAALLSPGVVLHVPGRHRLSGDYHGPEGVARFASASHAVAGGTERVQLVDLMAGRQYVAAHCLVVGEQAGHETLANRTVHVAKVESGRITEIWFHNFDQHAVDAFWGARHE